MTREEIMAMPAGPELDRLVAEALGEDTSTLTEHDWTDVDYLDNACSIQSCRRCGEMQYTCSCRRTQFVLPDCTPYIARYSTDVSAAWKAWEAMREQGYGVDIQWKGKGRAYENTAEVTITNNWISVAHSVADAVPLAICRAFLILKETGQ